MTLKALFLLAAAIIAGFLLAVWVGIHLLVQV